MEYFRNEERKEALGMRAKVRGARRGEARKEFTMGFMVVMIIVGNEGEKNDRLRLTNEWPRVIYVGGLIT